MNEVKQILTIADQDASSWIPRYHFVKKNEKEGSGSSYQRE